MGKVTGFLEIKSLKVINEPITRRIRHFSEFAAPVPDKEIMNQGARCMDCSVPFCHSAPGCPVENLIPEWNDLVYWNQWREAYERLELTNNFPEITGRICPAPCEKACVLAINDTPVTIKQIELAIIEKAFSEGWVKAKPPAAQSGKRVAIIGSGPAGLAAAQQLCRMGHKVTVFEKAPAAGGLLRYGIPDFKLEKKIIDRRLEQMKEEGVKFRINVNIGEDLSAAYLRKSYNALLIASGAAQPRNLQVEGRELNGIHFAMDYLTLSNRFIAREVTAREIISARDKNVLVIGGGDTGSDCVGTAIRQGAKSVSQYEILPEPPRWDQTSNPNWPHWPDILYTSTSHEEGCSRDWGIMTRSFGGERKKVKAANFVRVSWKTNGSGPVREMREISGSDFSMDTDLVLLAMGFLHVEHLKLHKDLELQYDTRGNLFIDDGYMTSESGVFAAGDAHHGASLVVTAIHHGRRAAGAINTFLQKL